MTSSGLLSNDRGRMFKEDYHVVAEHIMASLCSAKSPKFITVGAKIVSILTLTSASPAVELGQLHTGVHANVYDPVAKISDRLWRWRATRGRRGKRGQGRVQAAKCQM